ncbi:MAG: hypothetical protein ABIQ73_14765 [Acidimicrobiales bacterium]
MRRLEFGDAVQLFGAIDQAENGDRRLVVLGVSNGYACAFECSKYDVVGVDVALPCGTGGDCGEQPVGRAPE